MSITIRPATPDDAPSITLFVLAMALETEGLDLDPDRVARGVERVLAEPVRGFYLVAVEGDSIIGQLMVTYEWSDWNNRNRWWIQSVFVSATHRRKGVYRKLYNQCRLFADQAGDVCDIRLYVHRENQAAQDVYDRLGMQRTRYDIYESFLDSDS